MGPARKTLPRRDHGRPRILRGRPLGRVRCPDLALLPADMECGSTYTAVERGLVALIKCRECGGTMSDQASACPHCGAPASGTFAGSGAARRAHGWEGKVYVGLGYLAAVAFALSGLVFLLLPLTSGPRIRDTAEPGMILATFGGMAALAYACARGVRGFRAWGWWLATGISTLMVLVFAYALLRPPPDTDASSVRTGALLILAFHAVFLRYFLARRRDFGIGT